METRKDGRAPEQPESWPGVLVGLYPFFFFGPLMVWLAYSYPYPEWQTASAFAWLMAVSGLLPVAAGFGLGWLKRFPLWSYPYLCLAAGIFILGRAELLDGKVDLRLSGPVIVGYFLIIGLAALLAVATRRDSPIPNLVDDVRRDWTRLSLGLLIVPTVFFCAALIESGDLGFTVVPTVFGRGRTGLHAGDRVHPGGSSLLFLVATDREMTAAAELLRGVRDRERGRDHAHVLGAGDRAALRP